MFTRCSPTLPHRKAEAIGYVRVIFTEDDFNALAWAITDVTARAHAFSKRYYGDWDAARLGPVSDPDEKVAA